MATGNGAASIIAWAVFGALGGAFFFYLVVRHLTKSELARIGEGLPADSSALAIWVRTNNPRGLLEASAAQNPSVASVVAIDPELGAQVFVVPTALADRPPDSGKAVDDDLILSMVMLRYPTPEAAGEFAAHRPARKGDSLPSLEVALVIRSDAGGRVRVSDPQLGERALAKSDFLSWGAFGLVYGALVGVAGSGGALYGLMAGAAFSAKGLRGVGSLVDPETSILMAWFGDPVTRGTIDAFMTPGAQKLVLNVEPVEGGAVLHAT